MVPLVPLTTVPSAEVAGVGAGVGAGVVLASGLLAGVQASVASLKDHHRFFDVAS